MPPKKKTPTPEDENLVQDGADLPEVTLPDSEESNEDHPALEPVEMTQGAAADEPAPPAAVTKDDEPRTGMVDEPCRRCFPDGWPVPEQDAYVNCAHDFAIRYGDQIEIARERAVQLGFLTGEE